MVRRRLRRDAADGGEGDRRIPRGERVHPRERLVPRRDDLERRGVALGEERGETALELRTAIHDADDDGKSHAA